MKLTLLKTESDFGHKRFNRSISTASLRIRTALRSQNIPRFGFIIPKKVLPKVTDRNKVKRRLKSLLQRHQGSVKPFDVILFPQAASLKKTYSDLEKELIGGFKRLNIWK
jgi:ribonuclease P protein component